MVGCGQRGNGTEGIPFPPRAVNGDLRAHISSLQDRMPRRGEDGFVPPTDAELNRWKTLVERLVDADTGAVRSLLRTHFPSYALARFTDTTTGDTSLFLREAPAVEKGWGIVVVDPEASRDLIVEVPHPVFDLDTHRQGADLFRGADARVLLLAGTHRCSNRALSPCDGQTDVCEDDGRYHVSDMAHVVAAPFQATHEVLTDRGPDATTLSLHGNGNDDCEPVFLSSGVAADAPPVLDSLARALDERGVSVEMPGTSACPLVGSTNVQGRYTNGSARPCTAAASSATGRFIHVEQRRAFRADETAYRALIDAVATVFD